MNKTIKTKFGNVKIDKHGYYRISSRKEGNNGKILHRLIFEDYHNCKLDKNDVIHHIDGDKMNNHPTNLICMSRKAHQLLHHKGNNYALGLKKSIETKQKMSEAMKGIPKSEDHKMKLSESQNTTGYFRVYKNKSNTCKQGFTWIYRYYEDGKQNSISSVDIEKLEAKVREKGLKWLKFEEGLNK